MNLDGVYEGQVKVDGDHFMVEDNADGPGAFRACLDTGLARTSTGARIFGAMKGAVDGKLEDGTIHPNELHHYLQSLLPRFVTR